MRKFFQKLKDIYLSNKISFFIVIAIILGLALLSIDILTKQYKKADFFDNLISNAHGTIFDILILGILLTLYESQTHQRTEIARLKDEIDDYRFWKEPEAMHRMIGNIKRLKRLHFYKIDLACCNLRNAAMEGFILSHATIRETNFEESNLSGSEFIKTRVDGSNFINADLSSTNWSGTNVFNSKFMNANFMDADLSNTTFNGCDMTGCILAFTDLNGTRFNAVKLKDAMAYYSQKNALQHAGADVAEMIFEADERRDIENKFDRTVYRADVKQWDLSYHKKSALFRAPGLPANFFASLFTNKKVMAPNANQALSDAEKVSSNLFFRFEISAAMKQTQMNIDALSKATNISTEKLDRMLAGTSFPEFEEKESIYLALGMDKPLNRLTKISAKWKKP